jgi:Flp pilus assembly protein TadG
MVLRCATTIAIEAQIDTARGTGMLAQQGGTVFDAEITPAAPSTAPGETPDGQSSMVVRTTTENAGTVRAWIVARAEGEDAHRRYS